MTKVAKSWIESFSAYYDRRVVIMFFFGHASGLPLLLIFSSLSLWLREAGTEKGHVTYFSWAALAFSFKFVWAPLVDQLPIPCLSKLMGRRRSWLIFAQMGVFLSIVAMAMINPQGGSLLYMAFAAVALGLFAATQDIVIDAFRVEMAESDLQATLSSVYIAGYRVAMIVSGAGALYFAQYFGSSIESYSYLAWRYTYFIMASFSLLGVMTTLMAKEPSVSFATAEYTFKEYLHFFLLFIFMLVCFISCFVIFAEIIQSAKPLLDQLFHHSLLSRFLLESLRLVFAFVVTSLAIIMIAKMRPSATSMVKQAYLGPVKNFFERYGKTTSWILLALVGFYRVSDIVLGVISNVFYQDLGFSKIEIANVVKTFGLVMSLLGGFLGGVLTTRFGMLRILFWGSILSAGTNLLFMLLADLGHHLSMLYLVISADNLAAGLASAAFVAFLAHLTDISFTAIQYAIFTSLMTLFPKFLGGYSGVIVESMGYSSFFLMTTILGLPVIFLVLIGGKRLKREQS